MEIMLYRASSLTNRLTNQYLRVHGHTWLRAALRTAATDLLASPHSVEVQL